MKASHINFPLPKKVMKSRKLHDAGFLSYCKLTLWLDQKSPHLTQRPSSQTLCRVDWTGLWRQHFDGTGDDRYHGETDVCFLEGGAVVCSISSYRDNLPLLQHSAVDDTWDDKTQTQR